MEEWDWDAPPKPRKRQTAQQRFLQRKYAEEHELRRGCDCPGCSTCTGHVIGCTCDEGKDRIPLFEKGQADEKPLAKVPARRKAPVQRYWNFSNTADSVWHGTSPERGKYPF